MPAKPKKQGDKPPDRRGSSKSAKGGDDQLTETVDAKTEGPGASGGAGDSAVSVPAQATSTSVRVPTHVLSSLVNVHSMHEEETALVRPYMLTGGRTRGTYSLEMETLISAKRRLSDELEHDTIEHRSIVEACPSPRSVAEIAVNLRMPLGVARVLVSDAADAGLVNVHKTVSSADGAEAHLLLMERVLSGLRRL